MLRDLKSIELFVRVAKLGRIGKAGAEFGLSPTATTQRLQALEAVIGTQLLHRTTRSVSLSADGEVFLAHARRILEQLDDALSDVQAQPKVIQGELRVAAAASFGRKYIAPYIAEFLDKHPQISLDLHLSDSTFDIVKNGYDLAIRMGSLQPSTLKVQKLSESPRVLVAAPAYLEKSGIPERLEDLKHHECIIRDEMRRWSFRCPDGKPDEVRVSGKFSTNLAEAVTEAALSGLGIARKCLWEISDYLVSGDLQIVLPDLTVLPEWDIYAVRPPSRLEPPRIRVFKTFLKEKFDDIDALSHRSVQRTG